MPKRRANGEGNIRKRKDGRWEGRYTVGHDPETPAKVVRPLTEAEIEGNRASARGYCHLAEEYRKG